VQTLRRARIRQCIQCRVGGGEARVRPLGFARKLRKLAERPDVDASELLVTRCGIAADRASRFCLPREGCFQRACALGLYALQLAQLPSRARCDASVA
jgi:hypothetical protein